ncbi:type 4a pilus biogenesis protein PilO [Herbaspirillum lusitanum]|uniref:Type 4a pilus biogenesis protein PilO n=1 Tax=Herbaspirillum lusitanum TaxID=213312 RepID=A0ABW9ADN0_9BURK
MSPRPLNGVQTLRTHPAHWPRLPRTICLLLSMGLSLSAGWLFYVSDQTTALETLRQQLDDGRQLYQRKLKNAVQLLALHRQRDLQRQQLQELSYALHQDAAAPELQVSISELAARHGLQLALFKPTFSASRPAAANQDADTEAVEISLRGSYASLQKFLEELSLQSPLLLPEELHLNGDGVANPDRAGAATLSLKLISRIARLPATDTRNKRPRSGAAQGEQG